MIKKLSLFIASFLMLLFIFFVFVVTLNGHRFEGCRCKMAEIKEFASPSFATRDIPKIGPNKVIIVGDSRMELINGYKNKYNIPLNYSFIAKGGARISWFIEDALPELNNILINKNANYTYHVVINMGVNDINSSANVVSRADEYFSYYKSLVLKYPDVKFYLLSVNPIEKRLLKIYWPLNRANNNAIEEFNDRLIWDIKENKNIPIRYCDAYYHINFKTYDGLHYTVSTNQDIISYITNKCVNYT